MLVVGVRHINSFVNYVPNKRGYIEIRCNQTLNVCPFKESKSRPIFLSIKFVISYSLPQSVRKQKLNWHQKIYIETSPLEKRTNYLVFMIVMNFEYGKKEPPPSNNKNKTGKSHWNKNYYPINTVETVDHL